MVPTADSPLPPTLFCFTDTQITCFLLHPAARSGITLGNFEYRNAFLRLGDHSGNRFEIVLRNCTGSDEQIRQVMQEQEGGGKGKDGVEEIKREKAKAGGGE